MSEEARSQAIKALNRTHRYQGGGLNIALSIGNTGIRLAWALLDLADAVREHGAATERAATPMPPGPCAYRGAEGDPCNRRTGHAGPHTFDQPDRNPTQTEDGKTGGRIGTDKVR